MTKSSNRNISSRIPIDKLRPGDTFFIQSGGGFQKVEFAYRKGDMFLCLTVPKDIPIKLDINVISKAIGI